jgi:hypothetical protein
VDISISLTNGRKISFDVVEGDGPACFLLSVRKCGSSVTNNICRALAETNNRCFVDVGHTFFTNNIKAVEWRSEGALRQIVRPGVIYGGFRDAPVGLFDDQIFQRSPKLIMIRDPRDALVSEYFSNAHSHAIPAPSEGYDGVGELMRAQREAALSMDIGAYVTKRSQSMARAMELYSSVLSMPNVLVLKYENVILRKSTLIDQLASHFGLRVSQQNVDDILGWADVIPAEEDPRAFVRQVLPGDYMRKLGPKTIAKLNAVLDGAMRLFEYAP